jgi:CheY-like chemotaxis protein
MGPVLTAPPDPGHLVLVVEDDVDTREVLTEILASEGYRVRAAASAAEAMDLLAGLDAPPELALVDVVMPDKSGLDLIREMRLIPALAGVPVAVLSALPRGCVPDEPAGITEWLVKPPIVGDLLALVERLTTPPSQNGFSRRAP